MEYKKFNFEPEDGFLNSEFYEDVPGNPREILQRQHNQTRDYINSVIDILNSKREGESGSESIKSPSIKGVSGNNTFEQIRDIKRQLDAVALENVPDGSITSEKLADYSVTADKIKAASITSEKLSPDAYVPLAGDTLNVGGILAEEFNPVCKSGSLTVFKELVCNEEITTVKGKIRDNKRYIIDNGFLKYIDLLTGELKKVSDIEVESDMRFAFVNNSEIVFAKYVDSKLSFYKYNTEFNSLDLINEFNFPLANQNYAALIDIFSDEDHIYVCVADRSNTEWRYTIGNLAVSDMETAASIGGITNNDGKSGGSFFLAGEDYVCADMIFRKKKTMEKIPGGIVTDFCDGLLLMNAGKIVLKSAKTFLPVIGCADSSESANSFIYDKHYYKLIENYLFKTRIL